MTPVMPMLPTAWLPISDPTVEAEMPKFLGDTATTGTNTGYTA